jgi:hypothetical protein
MVLGGMVLMAVNAWKTAAGDERVRVAAIPEPA